MERPQRKHETTTHRSKDKNKKLFSTQFRIQPTTFLHSIPLSFHVYTTTHSSPPFPLHNPLPMQTILQMLLEVLDHAQRQRRVNLARTINTSDPRQKHRFAAFRSSSTGGGHLGRAENCVGGGGDEVGFHERLELRVWVARAQGGDAGVEPGWWRRL
jgi:hypothetical protein